MMEYITKADVAGEFAILFGGLAVLCVFVVILILRGEKRRKQIKGIDRLKILGG